jgi:polynucleotide 5'-hydroxyl-kinase GRC3/NOL9
MSDASPPWDIPASWRPALEAARAGGTLLLLGATDTGKSTLAAVLAHEACAGGRRTAVVDADVGQSTIGPPACVSMALVDGQAQSLDELSPAAIDFVGACSPIGHLLQCAAATRAMAAAARESRAEAVIVDTTGLIAGSSARALKSAKVRLTDADAIVALQAEDEIEHLLAPYAARARPQVVRLPLSRAVRPRSRDERASRRQRRFAAYFRNAAAFDLSWDTAPIENSAWTSGETVPGHLRAYAEECVGREVLHAERTGDGLLLIADGVADRHGLRRLADGFGGITRAIDAGALDSLLIGLIGARGDTLELGIMEHVDFERRRFAVRSPLTDADAVRGIRLGSIRIARDGAQLGANEPGAAG